MAVLNRIQGKTISLSSFKESVMKNNTTDLTIKNNTNVITEESERKTQSIFLNLCSQFRKLINPETGKVMSLTLPTNNTGKDVTKSLGLGVDFMLEGAEAMVPKRQPKEDDYIGNMKARAPKIAEQVMKEINEVRDTLEPSERGVAYHLCRETTDELYIKVVDEDGTVHFEPVQKQYYVKTPANLVLEVNGPVAEPEEYTTENDGGIYDLDF